MRAYIVVKKDYKYIEISTDQNDTIWMDLSLTWWIRTRELNLLRYDGFIEKCKVSSRYNLNVSIFTLPEDPRLRLYTSTKDIAGMYYLATNGSHRHKIIKRKLYCCYKLIMKHATKCLLRQFIDTLFPMIIDDSECMEKECGIIMIE